MNKLLQGMISRNCLYRLILPARPLLFSLSVSGGSSCLDERAQSTGPAQQQLRDFWTPRIHSLGDREMDIVFLPADDGEMKHIYYYRTAPPPPRLVANNKLLMAIKRGGGGPD